MFPGSYLILAHEHVPCAEVARRFDIFDLVSGDNPCDLPGTMTETPCDCEKIVILSSSTDRLGHWNRHVHGPMVSGPLTQPWTKAVDDCLKERHPTSATKKENRKPLPPDLSVRIPPLFQIANDPSQSNLALLAKCFLCFLDARARSIRRHKVIFDTFRYRTQRIVLITQVLRLFFVHLSDRNDSFVMQPQSPELS